MTRIFTAGLVLCSLLFSMTSMAGHHAEKMKAANLVETASAAGQFETLIAAAKAAGLVPALTGDGPLTVFAPTDDAFGALPAGTIENLLKPANKDQLATILKYHVIAGRVTSGALADGAELDTLAGPIATITETEKGFAIEGARIVSTDIDASNGIVHVIDRVILPPQQMTRIEALMMIDSAIAKGVPLFNHGNPGKTVEIYDAAAMQLLNAGPEMSAHDRTVLTRSLAESRSMQDASASAWRLRHALDDVGRSLAMSR